eukprot:TRINITY_DN3700_c0_g1_i1.p1 TRINITY_DN3700_c0_g1~~TRINITY_DN3700_c0_g1_i1.p1  ORF type:complete len:267 (-),score=100.06 TRINITY_DN3700_c0_g1_i1:174-974(-)
MPPKPSRIRRSEKGQDDEQRARLLQVENDEALAKQLMDAEVAIARSAAPRELPAPAREKRSVASKLCTALCDDKPTIAVVALNAIGFGLMVSGLVIYFVQYDYHSDRSDESWLYVVFWIVPCLAFILGTVIYLSSSFQFRRCLCFLPVLSVLQILVLLLIGYLFYEAYANAQNALVCHQSSAMQDDECVVAKDGHQICGSRAIRELCGNVELGFYLIIMGAGVMALTQLLFIVSSCMRRSSLKEEAAYVRPKHRDRELHSQDGDDV